MYYQSLILRYIWSLMIALVEFLALARMGYPLIVNEKRAHNRYGNIYI